MWFNIFIGFLGVTHKSFPEKLMYLKVPNFPQWDFCGVSEESQNASFCPYLRVFKIERGLSKYIGFSSNCLIFLPVQVVSSCLSWRSVEYFGCTHKTNGQAPDALIVLMGHWDFVGGLWRNLTKDAHTDGPGQCVVA